MAMRIKKSKYSRIPLTEEYKEILKKRKKIKFVKLKGKDKLKIFKGKDAFEVYNGKGKLIDVFQPNEFKYAKKYVSLVNSGRAKPSSDLFFDAFGLTEVGLLRKTNSFDPSLPDGDFSVAEVKK